jgi:putative two-component system response regulator
MNAHRIKVPEVKVAKRNEKLRRNASLEAIYRLSRAAEYRDDDTGSHIRRVSHYAAAVAHRMGENDRFVETLRHSVPMHDIGKIGIPDSILLKPGKLTPHEWEIMKTHTTIGGKILHGSDFELIQSAYVITLTHHEKWDGSGYPKGLRGEDIPIEGRITAIVDVFDALTTKRPYKAAFPLENAYAIIKKERGRHFDPMVVDAFFAAEDELLSIWAKYRER